MLTFVQILKKMTMFDVYEQIKNVASSKGVKLQDLAQKLGVTRQTLNASMKSPSYPTLTRIAEALEIPVWELLTPAEEAPGAMPEERPHAVCPHCGGPLQIHFEVK